MSNNDGTVTIRFFARLREQVGMEQMQMPLPEGVRTIGQIAELIMANHPKLGSEALLAEQVVTARNHNVVGFDERVAAGDEIAFFPPVTGG